MRFLTARFSRTAKPDAAPRARRLRRWSRRQWLAVGAGAMLLVLGGAGWWLERSGVIAATAAAVEQRFYALTASLGFAVADVRVEGRLRTSRETILGTLNVGRGTPILGVDLAQAKRRLETLPWVRSAAVERRLPDTLFVRIVEREPLAYWQRLGKLVMVDREGTVLPNEPLEGAGTLIVLVGADAPKAGDALLAMLAGESELATHVAAAVRIGGRRWNLRLDNGVDVALPEDDPAAAWHRLGALERSDGILERDVELIDLRFPDRLILRSPAPETAKPPPKKGHQPGKST
jgi:cell division protein FtsQ